MNLYNLIPPQILSGFAFVGTICLILAYKNQYGIKNILSTGTRTIGTVIEIRKDPDGKEGEAPVVDFDYPNGTYRHHSTTYTSPCAYHVGQRVEIWYKFYKSNREAALPHEKPGRLPKILLISGIILCLLSYPAIIMKMMNLI